MVPELRRIDPPAAELADYNRAARARTVPGHGTTTATQGLMTARKHGSLVLASVWLQSRAHASTGGLVLDRAAGRVAIPFLGTLPGAPRGHEQPGHRVHRHFRADRAGIRAGAEGPAPWRRGRMMIAATW
jgi:hypothetical protein